MKDRCRLLLLSPISYPKSTLVLVIVTIGSPFVLTSPTFLNFAAPETQTFRDNEQSCCCQRKENVFEDATFGRPAPQMNQQDLDLLSKSVSKTPSVSNPVLRLMGKDLMVINQREEASHGDPSLIPTSQFHDL
ncbi:unnamed protein product, partial [Brassica oleracea]